MQICEYFFENACYSVTKYYLCKQNNKRPLLGRKQRHQVVRSFPNRYLFSLTNKLTFLFPISCILEIILPRYAATHPQQVERIKRSLDRPFMTDNLPQLIFDLLGVRTKYYKPESSVINDAYRPQKQRKLQVGREYN